MLAVMPGWRRSACEARIERRGNEQLILLEARRYDQAIAQLER